MLARASHHHRTAPAHSSRPAALGLVTRGVAPAVHPDATGTGFTRSKPSWPSSACEPPVRRKPAPAGRRQSAGYHHRTWDTSVETPHPPVPAASPRQSATCRGGKVFHQWFQPNRSSRSPRQPRHGHARLSSLPNIPDGNRGDGLPQGVVRRKHPVIPVPVPPGRWDQRRQPVEKLVQHSFCKSGMGLIEASVAS